jgi:hypothetical protein
MKLFVKGLVATAFIAVSLAAFSSVTVAQTAQPSPATQAVGPETDDTAKIAIYMQFYNNHKNNQALAYKAAREYLQRYAKDKDGYVDYLNKWVLIYERDERRNSLPGFINQKNFAEAFATGAKILADEPDNLRVQIDLGYAGYLAASAKNETHNTVALGYAKKAIAAIESGKAPETWAPFKGKEDTLAYLNYAVGFLTLKTNPNEALDALLKAAQYNSDIKTTASTYYFLGVAYETGPYKTLSTAYSEKYANKPETPESKAALEKLNVVMDRIIDAYARAIATAQSDPKTEQSRKEWMTQLSTYYKFRNAGSEAGIDEFIKASLQKPLPPKP